MHDYSWFRFYDGKQGELFNMHAWGSESDHDDIRGTLFLNQRLIWIKATCTSFFLIGILCTKFYKHLAWNNIYLAIYDTN